MRAPKAKPLGFVEISRKRGRIAGFAKPSVPVKILWCGTNRPRTGIKYNRWLRGEQYLPFETKAGDAVTIKGFNTGTTADCLTRRILPIGKTPKLYTGDWME